MMHNCPSCKARNLALHKKRKQDYSNLLREIARGKVKVLYELDEITGLHYKVS